MNGGDQIPRRQLLKGASGGLVGIASGAENTAEQREPLPNTIVIIGEEETHVDYDITVSGSINPNENLDRKLMSSLNRSNISINRDESLVNEGDVLDEIGSTITGFVHGGIDAYNYSGEIVAFDYSGGKIKTFVNNQEIKPHRLVRSLQMLQIRAISNDAKYELQVSGILRPGAEQETKSEYRDKIRFSDSKVEGKVSHGNTDSFRFSGEIISFTYQGNVDLLVNGDKIDPDLIGRPPHRLLIEAVEETSYELEVMGDVEPGPGYENKNDRINSVNKDNTTRNKKKRIIGTLGKNGVDVYWFSGEITDLYPTDGSIALSVNSDNIDNLEYPNKIEINVSSGSQGKYYFSVNGEIKPGEGNKDDNVWRSEAHGSIRRSSNIYYYSGEMSGFDQIEGQLDIIINESEYYPSTFGLPASQNWLEFIARENYEIITLVIMVTGILSGVYKRLRES